MNDSTTKPPYSSLSLFLIILLVLCFVAKCFLLFSIIDRGFDMGDEGDLLLMYRNSHFYSYNFFAKLSHTLFIKGANPISQYRRYKYFFDCYSAVFLSSCLAIWFYRSFASSPALSSRHLITCTVSFGLLGFALSPYSPTQSYNDFTNVFMSTVIGLLFILLSKGSGKSVYREYIICFVMGMAFYMQTAVKMEISIILGVMLFFAFCFIPVRKPLVKLLYILSFIAGFAFVIIAFDPNPYQPVTASLKKEASYSVIGILSLYLSRDLYHLVIAGSCIILCFVIRLYTKGSTLFYLIAIALPLITVSLFCGIGIYDLQIDLQLCILISLIFLWYQKLAFDTGSYPSSMGMHKNIFLLAFIFLLPLVLIAGTNSPLTEAFPLVAFPWFIIAGMLIWVLIQDGRTSAYTFILSLALISSASYQFIHNRVTHPFKLSESSFRNIVKNPYLYNIKTDSATVLFCGQMTGIMHRNGFRAGDTIVTMGFSSGIAYMLDAKMELTAFYLPDGWGDHYNCYCLSSLHHYPKFVILPTDQVGKFDSCFGRQRAGKYDYIDSIYYPYANTYYHNTDQYLRLYKFRNQ